MREDETRTKSEVSEAKRGRRQTGMEEDQEQGEQPVHVGDKMAPALIAVHPKDEALVVAIGAGLRIFDFTKDSPVTTADGTTPGRHGEAIRAVAFSTDGNLFASAGDDKLVKLWDTKLWTCVRTIRLAKKVTGVSFSLDSNWLLLADKFGVVFVLPTSTSEKLEEPSQLLAHCCSIITDLKVSPDGKYIITADRDCKIRVSVFPAIPTTGAHEIWSYCLGHTSFVTCVAFVGEPRSSQQLLVSGSGDATVRLWDYKTGELLDSFDTVDVLVEQSKHGSVEENNRAVICVSVSPDGLVVAVIIERYAGVLLLGHDSHLKKLRHLQSLPLPELILPTSIVFDFDCRLWLVAGAAETVDSSDRSVTTEDIAAAESKAHAIAQTAVARVRLIWSSSPSTTMSKSNLDDGEEQAARSYGLCEGDAMPGGKALLLALQGRSVTVDNATKEVAVAAEAAELAMRKLMTKRQYTIAQREYRKRSRNDKKLENKRV